MTRNPLVRRARAQRRQMSDAEMYLWVRLRRRQIGGVRFRRQVPIGPYIADFASHAPKLVVEVDGLQHLDDAEYDARRDAFLMAQGYTVARIWADDVVRAPDLIADQIASVVQDLQES